MLLHVKGQVYVRLHPQDLDEVGRFRHLKIGRRSRAREREKLKLKSFINHQLIKDKIYLFRKDLTGRNGAKKLFRVTARRSG